MKRIDKIVIILSHEDKEELEKYGSITKYEDDESTIVVRYDN